MTSSLKVFIKTTTVSFIIFLLIALLSSCQKDYTYTEHSCRWSLCPYKGVTPEHYSEAVSEYSGCNEGSDCYYIDILHLEYPNEDYDQLEDRLFTHH